MTSAHRDDHEAESVLFAGEPWFLGSALEPTDDHGSSALLPIPPRVAAAGLRAPAHTPAVASGPPPARAHGREQDPPAHHALPALPETVLAAAEPWSAPQVAQQLEAPAMDLPTAAAPRGRTSLGTWVALLVGACLVPFAGPILLLGNLLGRRRPGEESRLPGLVVGAIGTAFQLWVLLQD